MPSKAPTYDPMAEQRVIKEVVARFAPSLASDSLLRLTCFRYVGQLLYGCGDATCKQVICATGRRNTSKRPVRDYTPRSARAIALTLVSGASPKSRLCEKYEHHRSKDSVAREEGPLDPSSFMQLLCETDTIRRLCDPHADTTRRPSRK
jgi:hypothetical protein